jgi:cell division protein FtsQ
VGTGGPAQGDSRADGVVVPLPGNARPRRFDLPRAIPSGRSIGIALLVVVGGLLAWFGARETGVFAVRTIDVAGASPSVAAQVRRALAPTRGTSLLKVDLAGSRGIVTALPTVAGVRFDRAFPHTLRVVVVPERPVAVARQGANAFLVAESGRVMAAVGRRDRPRLPRLWVKRGVQLAPGTRVDGDVRTAVAALAPLVGSRFPGRVASVTAAPDALTLRLRSRLELRLGDRADVPLKLAVAARVIPLLADGTPYLDVSVPERPVAGSLNSQVEPYTSPSTTP